MFFHGETEPLTATGHVPVLSKLGQINIHLLIFPLKEITAFTKCSRNSSDIVWNQNE